MQRLPQLGGLAEMALGWTVAVAGGGWTMAGLMAGLMVLWTMGVWMVAVAENGVGWITKWLIAHFLARHLGAFCCSRHLQTAADPFWGYAIDGATLDMNSTNRGTFYLKWANLNKVFQEHLKINNFGAETTTYKTSQIPTLSNKHLSQIVTCHRAKASHSAATERIIYWSSAGPSKSLS